MRFSIVIPAYNVADYLEKCVQSVEAQTCGDWEAILVDDGSTDGVTGALCDTLAQKYGARWRVIHQANGGLGAARNTGLEAARGDYLVFLDSDDYLAPHMLETVASQIEKESCDIVTFGFAVDKNGDTGEVHLDDLPADCTFTLQEYPRLLLATPNAWNRVYRREFFLRSGVRYPGRVWFEDIRTTMKLFALAQSIRAVPQPLYYYVVREGSITRNAKADRNREILEAFDDLLAFYRERGLYETYRNELCRLAIDHIYLAASVRVLLIDRKSPLLREFADYMDRQFPDYRSNPYLGELSRARRLAFSLLEKRHYGALYLLFRAKGK